MLWVRAVTVGEGNNKRPFTPMRGTKGGCGKHFPFRIIPDLGQIPQDDLNPIGEQPPDVFDDDVPGTHFPDEPCVFEPQAAARPFLDSRMFSSLGYVLTGEAAAERVHGRRSEPFKAVTSSYMGMPGQCLASTDRQNGSTSQNHRCSKPTQLRQRSHRSAPLNRLPTFSMEPLLWTF